MNILINRKSVKVYTLGRILIASLFVLGAVNKIMSPSITLERIASNIGEPAFLILGAVIIIEGVCGILLAIGHRFASLSAVLLAFFTLCTNVFFHRFWEADPSLRTLELSLVFKNITILGALLLVSVTEKTDREHLRILLINKHSHRIRPSKLNDSFLSFEQKSFILC